MKLEGKVAIVTAAGQGIGRGIALCLAEEGADVVVNALHEESAGKVAAEVKALGRKSLPVAGDVSQSEKELQVVQETINTFGKIDILVSNLGTARTAEPGPGLLDQVEAEWEANYRFNLKPTFLMCEAVVPYFIKQKSGKIVNISSVAARNVIPFAAVFPETAYGCMKVAIIRFTKKLATELGKYNINANCICPGLVYTPAWAMGAKMTVETVPEYKGIKPRDWFVQFLEGKYPELGLTPLGREQTVEDIGRAVVFLVSEDAKNITGQSLNIDGGLFMPMP